VKVAAIGTILLLTVGLAAYIVRDDPASDVAAPPSPTVERSETLPQSAPSADLRNDQRSPDRRRLPHIGVSVPSIDSLDRFIDLTGTIPRFVGVFGDWSDHRPFPRDIADAVAAGGEKLSITWEPWDSTLGTADQRRYNLGSIIAGKHDQYIDAYARSIKSYPHPVNIRFMHEMNGFWYPWATGVNGNKPGQYVEA
jgi:hypothetical protein